MVRPVACNRSNWMAVFGALACPAIQRWAVRRLTWQMVAMVWAVNPYDSMSVCCSNFIYFRPVREVKRQKNAARNHGMARKMPVIFRLFSHNES